MTVNLSELRLKMVDSQLRPTDVTSHDVLRAFLEVPREEFVPAKRRETAYVDEDVEVARNRFVMEPAPLARLIQLADIRPEDVVLDVGCATGYSSAVLSRLGSSVIAIEQDETLAAGASDKLAALGYDSVVVLNSPLAAGYAAEAPYDVIFVGGAVDEVPHALIDQLREGGRLVCVEGAGNAGVAKLYVRENGQVSGRRAFNCAVKPLPGFQAKAEFAF